MEINFKILGYRKAQRYAVRRSIEQALSNLPDTHSDLMVNIEEIKDIPEIFKYTQVLIYPSVVINEQLVCVGRIPKQKEVKVLITQEINKINGVIS